MKKNHLPWVLLLAPALFANHATITDVGGLVAPLVINLTLRESIGGYAVDQAFKTNEAAKGVTYPDFSTFSTTYAPDQPVSAIRDPFGWDPARAAHHVERVTTNSANPTAPVVTAAGVRKLYTSRYTNATLLADLVAAGLIDSAQGYRIVAVKFELDHEVHFDIGAYNTHVNDHLYFFVERGAEDPAPVFLGAEYQDIYVFTPVIGLTRHAIVRTGRYVDTFTGDPVEGGFDYALNTLNESVSSAGEYVFYRPAPSGNLYAIRAGGLLRWTERYDARRGALLIGAPAGGGLVGPAEGNYVTDENADGVAETLTANGGNPAIVSGSVSANAPVRQASMLRYLNRLPPVLPH